MHMHANLHTHTRTKAVGPIVSGIFLIMIPRTDEAVTRDHCEADSSKLGPNLEGIESTVIAREMYTVFFNLLLVGVSKG